MRYGIPLPSRTEARFAGGKPERDIEGALQAAAGFFTEQLRKIPASPAVPGGDAAHSAGAHRALRPRLRPGGVPEHPVQALRARRAAWPTWRRPGSSGAPSESGEPYDRFRHRLMFPIHNAVRPPGRLRRPHPGGRQGEVRQHHRDRPLPQGLAPLRPPPRQAGDPGDRAGRPLRGVLRRHRHRRLRAGGGGRRHGHRPHPRAGEAPVALRRGGGGRLRRRQRGRERLPPRPAAAARRGARGAAGALPRLARSGLPAPGGRGGGGAARRSWGRRTRSPPSSTA